MVNGALTPRAKTVVSVVDAGSCSAAGCGGASGARRPPRVPRPAPRPALRRAKALALDIGLSQDDLRRALYDTLRANGMTDGVHVRLMVTQGVKRTRTRIPG